MQARSGITTAVEAAAKRLTDLGCLSTFVRELDWLVERWDRRTGGGSYEKEEKDGGRAEQISNQSTQLDTAHHELCEVDQDVPGTGELKPIVSENRYGEEGGVGRR